MYFFGYFGINSEHWDLGEEVFFDKRWCLFASQLWSWSLLNGVTRSFLVFTQGFFPSLSTSRGHRGGGGKQCQQVVKETSDLWKSELKLTGRLMFPFNFFSSLSLVFFALALFSPYKLAFSSPSQIALFSISLWV